MNLVWGALVFGFVIGWVTYRTLRRANSAGIGDIAAVIGAVGGAAVLELFPAQPRTFPWYAIGLAGGFFPTWLLQSISHEQAKGRVP
jgi:uncharacterized membrane protein YeaQ/YmgE (transglycosylase-associated protein family)